jgi:hypothetical protein
MGGLGDIVVSQKTFRSLSRWERERHQGQYRV